MKLFMVEGSLPIQDTVATELGKTGNAVDRPGTPVWYCTK